MKYIKDKQKDKRGLDLELLNQPEISYLQISYYLKLLISFVFNALFFFFYFSGVSLFIYKSIQI